MKISVSICSSRGNEAHFQSESPHVGYRKRRKHKRGSAVILVLVLAGIMAALISDNGLVLHRLKQEIKLIEKKQAKKYQRPPLQESLRPRPNNVPEPAKAP